ncbi:MAG TPA: PAS domain-containing sensor histidine kinase [Candidatus Saccharimonadales bacterium]|nr:PAS domain-containing sensor histidine kinase [Candidatus Saccharimonadales bacterium]
MAEKSKHSSRQKSVIDVSDFENFLEEYTSRLEAQVARESRFYRMMADAMPQIVWTADVNGKADYFNKRWFEFTGLTEAESLHSGWLSIVHAEDLKRVNNAWSTSIKNGSPYEIEARLKERQKGSYKWFLVRALPGSEGGKKIIKWFGTCTDIDEHKKNQANKDEFIAITSHELKTPLTSIKAFNQVVEMQLKKIHHSDALDITEKMSLQIDRLNDLINDLLDISLLDTGKLKLNKTRFDFDEFVFSAVENMRLINPNYHLKIQGRSGKKIFADRSRLEQVIINLVSNAIKYSPDSKKVLINLDKDSSNVYAHIKDYGIGIAKADQAKIFERFYRVERPLPEAASGFGLGLYIANEVLSKQKGRLWVESNLGKGSTFSFTLPAIKGS